MEKSTNERIYIFYKHLTSKYNFLKKLCIDNIEKDIKNEKVENKKNEYIELINKFSSLFEDEIQEQTINEIDDLIFDDDLPENIE